MKVTSVAASPRAARRKDKPEDNRDFKGRWIPFGMALKNRADALGVDWCGKSFEQWMSEIILAEEWAKFNEGEADA